MAHHATVELAARQQASSFPTSQSNVTATRTRPSGERVSTTTHTNILVTPALEAITPTTSAASTDLGPAAAFLSSRLPAHYISGKERATALEILATLSILNEFWYREQQSEEWDTPSLWHT